MLVKTKTLRQVQHLLFIKIVDAKGEKPKRSDQLEDEVQEEGEDLGDKAK